MMNDSYIKHFSKFETDLLHTFCFFQHNKYISIIPSVANRKLYYYHLHAGGKHRQQKNDLKGQNSDDSCISKHTRIVHQIFMKEISYLSIN